MEKFGIFELLDALSAITAAEPADRPRQDDAAYRAPVYGGAFPEQTVQKKTPYPDGALSSFLARHDEIAKKVPDSHDTKCDEKSP